MTKNVRRGNNFAAHNSAQSTWKQATETQQMSPELLKLKKKTYNLAEHQYLLLLVTEEYMETVRTAKTQSPILRLSISCWWLIDQRHRMVTMDLPGVWWLLSDLGSRRAVTVATEK